MNNIIVPAERLAELLKAEHELTLLEAGGVDNWEWYSESLRGDADDEELEPLRKFEKRVNKALKNGELAVEFGFGEKGEGEVNVVIDDAGNNLCVGE